MKDVLQRLYHLAANPGQKRKMMRALVVVLPLASGLWTGSFTTEIYSGGTCGGTAIVTVVTTRVTRPATNVQCMDLAATTASGTITTVAKVTSTCSGPYATRDTTIDNCNSDCSSCTGVTTVNDYPAGWPDSNSTCTGEYENTDENGNTIGRSNIATLTTTTSGDIETLDRCSVPPSPPTPPSPTAGSLSWVKSSAGGICAGSYGDCSSAQQCVTVGVGPCTGSEPTRYVLQETMGLAFVKEAEYLSCDVTSGLCPGKMFELSGEGPGWRDLDGNASTGAGGSYAYTMTGDLYGDSWGGYIGMSGYFNTGSSAITSSTINVYIAGPASTSHVDRADSAYGAPDGPYTLCIADGTDTQCSSDRTFPVGAYKMNIFGYTYEQTADQYKNEYASATQTSGSWGFVPDHLGVRVKLSAVGWDPTGVTFNSGAFDFSTIGNNDISQMSINHAEGSIDYSFPTNFRYGTTAGAQPGGATLDLTGGGTVKIKASHSTSSHFYLDFLIPIGDATLTEAGRYFVYDPDVTTSLAPPPGSSTAPPPGMAASDDSPCFAADSATACKVTSPATLTPAEAHQQCFSESQSAGAARVLMKSLTAGDVVLAAEADASSGAMSMSFQRVVVNQHRAGTRSSPLLELHHSVGTLTLTPDHLLIVGGRLAPARDAKPGSTLTLMGGETAIVQKVTATHGAIINPVTENGIIMAAGRTGAPIVAATHPEWSAPFMMKPLHGYAPLPFFYGLAAVFPEDTQAYYEALLEPLFDSLGPYVKPAGRISSALVLPLVAADAAAAAGLILYIIKAFAIQALCAVVGVVLVLGARPARK